MGFRTSLAPIVLFASSCGTPAGPPAQGTTGQPSLAPMPVAAALLTGREFTPPPEPLLWLAPHDATARGIDDRARIRIWNERGEMLARAHVTDRMRAGTVWMRDGWDGLNVLTSGAPVLPDAATDVFGFSAGQAAFDAAVDVAVAKDDDCCE